MASITKTEVCIKDEVNDDEIITVVSPADLEPNIPIQNGIKTESELPDGGDNAKAKLFRCYLCKFVTGFEDKTSLEMHLASLHPETGKYECQECNYNSERTTHFNRHLSRHDANARPFKCGICFYRFAAIGHLKKHKLTTHYDGMLKMNARSKTLKTTPISSLRCYLCNVHNELQTNQLLRQHLRAVHPFQSSYQCWKCPYSTTKIENFNNHHLRHDSRKSKFKCSFCPRRFLSARFRRYHKHAVHKTKPSKQQLSEHRMEKMGERIKRFVESRDSLYQHLAATHPEQSYHRCGECNATFRSKTNFIRHLSRHDANERPHKCSVCSLRFASKIFKKRHEMFFQHADRVKQETYRCTICGKKFRRQKNLKLHEKSSHNSNPERAASAEEHSNDNSIKTGEIRISVELAEKKNTETNSPFVCYLCEGSPCLESESSFLIHMYTSHTQRTKYQCTICRQHRVNILSFNNHLKRHNVRAVSYICPETLSRNERRDNHETVHVNEVQQSNVTQLAISCSKCEKIFKSQDELTIHLREHEFLQDNSQHSHPAAASGSSIANCEPAVTISAQKATPRKLLSRCFICDPNREMRDKQSLEEHLLNSHPHEDVYRCEQCLLYRPGIISYNYHLQRHDALACPYQCHLCLTRFGTLENKRLHEMNVHQRRCCPFCKNMLQLEKFDEHILTQHPEEKRACSACGAEFYFERDLRLHTQHSECKRTIDINFKCYLCSSVAVFKRKALLHDHLQTAHRTRSRYRCRKCKYTTTLVSCLNEHLSKHRASEPSQDLPNNVTRIYRCHLCSPNSTQDSRESLLQHLGSAHPTQDMYQCGECSFSVNLVTMFNQHLAQHNVVEKILIL